MNAVIRIGSQYLERVPLRAFSESGRGAGLRHGGVVLLLLLAWGAIQGALLLALVLLATLHGPAR